MFNTLKELVEATLKIYENVDSLSKQKGYSTCQYAHDTNGVGCALGCHIDAHTAWQWDQEGLTIFRLTTDPQFAHMRKPLGLVINLDTITPIQLQKLQAAHDDSDTVEEFRGKLRGYLMTGSESWLAKLDDYGYEQAAQEYQAAYAHAQTAGSEWSGYHDHLED